MNLVLEHTYYFTLVVLIQFICLSLRKYIFVIISSLGYTAHKMPPAVLIINAAAISLAFYKITDTLICVHIIL